MRNAEVYGMEIYTWELYIIATILFSSFSVTQNLYRKWRDTFYERY